MNLKWWIFPCALLNPFNIKKSGSCHKSNPDVWLICPLISGLSLMNNDNLAGNSCEFRNAQSNAPTKLLIFCGNIHFIFTDKEKHASAAQVPFRVWSGSNHSRQ